MNKNKIIKMLSKLYLKLLGKECVVLKHNPLMHYMEEGSKTYARYNPVLAVNLVITDYFNDHQTRPIITNIGIQEDENKIEVTLHTNRPGLIIGYGGGTFDELEKSYVHGITFSGGDPLHAANVDGVTQLAKEIKEKYPNKSIWLYTGSTWEEVKDLEIVQYLDVLVDGEFVLAQKDVNLHWVGSSNQKVISVKETLKIGKIVLHE